MGRWRHRSDVTRQQYVGARAVRPRAARRDIGNDRHTRTEYGLHDIAHRFHEATRRIHANDNEVDVTFLRIIDTVDNVFGSGDAQCTIQIQQDSRTVRPGSCRQRKARHSNAREHVPQPLHRWGPKFHHKFMIAGMARLGMRNQRVF